MAKNYQKLFDTGNDSNALSQRFYLKQESARGTLIAPAGTDGTRVLEGGGVTFARGLTSSPDRSGRHHTKSLEEKDITTFSLPMLFHVDTSLGTFNVAEVDPAVRLLWTSLLGREQTTPNLIYDSADAPDLTFSIFEIGDVWSNQAPGCFVQQNSIDLPGTGNSQMNWSGFGKTVYRAGIAKSSTDNDGGNTVTVTDADHAQRFEVGAMVMLIEADGTTRSADTPDGSPRTITDISGAVVTLDGAALADADFSGADGYLVYYEPETFAPINDPLTGLDGSFTISGLNGTHCLRSATIEINNNHELQDFCWGERGLAGPLFSPAGRLDVNVSIELNLNHELWRYINNLKLLTGSNIVMNLGDVASRYAKFTMPKVDFPIPEIPVPATGSIPVSFSQMAKQTADDAADEIKAEYL